MTPIGFGLENFDAAGKWRTTDRHKHKKWTIDASGAFYKGPKFSGYQELRHHIVKREEDFARGFTEHLIEYALGRPFGFTDEDLALEIMAKAKQFNRIKLSYSISSFIQALAQTDAFKVK